MTTKLMLALMLGLAAAIPAAAQDAAPRTLDSRWARFIGCWKIVQENLGEHPVPLAPGTTVCVRRSESNAIVITTTVDGKDVLEQTIVADGTPQPVSQGDCTGAQTSQWSRDGERLFTKAAITCMGRPPRVVSGLSMMAKGYWVDSQATLIDGRQDVRVRRYQRAEGYTGPFAAAPPMTIEDVIEASANVQSEALEAALDEAGRQLTVNSRSLRQLADNGVAPNVIDLMVAQAYPSHFRVERNYPQSSGGSAWISSGSSVYAASPYPFAGPYDPYFYNSYYYSPFAYPYYWGAYYNAWYGYPYYRNYYNYYGNPYNSYNNSWPSGGSVGGGSWKPDNGHNGGSGSDQGDGVVVNGRGYTRVRPTSSGDSGGSASGGSSNTGSRTRTSGSGSRGVNSGSSSGSSSSSSSSGSSSSSSSSGSSGGGSAGSGGYSGGGNSGGGGRTAQPR